MFVPGDRGRGRCGRARGGGGRGRGRDLSLPRRLVGKSAKLKIVTVTERNVGYIYNSCNSIVYITRYMYTTKYSNYL